MSHPRPPPVDALLAEKLSTLIIGYRVMQELAANGTFEHPLVEVFHVLRSLQVMLESFLCG